MSTAASLSEPHSAQRTPTAETETQRAIREQWCNGCHQPRAEWGPVCPGMYVGDWTHFHSPEFWLYREARMAGLWTL